MRCAHRCCRRNHVAVLVDAAGQRASSGQPARADDRHRPAVAHRHRAWPPQAISTPTVRQTPFIDAEAEQDPTAAGKRNAARGGGRPTADRREESRVAIGHRGRHAGQHHRAVDHRRVRAAGSAGDCCSRSRDVLRRDPRVWERRSSEVAQTVVIGLYPSWDISQDGLDAADSSCRPDVRRRCALVLEAARASSARLRARHSTRLTTRRRCGFARSHHALVAVSRMSTAARKRSGG